MNTQNNTMSISEKLKEIRNSKALTQKEMAARLKIKRSAYGSYEEGRAKPPIRILLGVSLLAEVSLEELILACELRRP